jgi:hypothetical protein
VLDSFSALLPYVAAFDWTQMPLGRLVAASGLTAFWSPWFMLCELVLLLFILPHIIGYWLASQDDPERFNIPTLTACFLIMSGLLFLGVKDGLNVAAVLAAMPFIVSLGVVENTWWMVRRKNAAIGTGGISIERLRARNYLTRDLGLWLILLGGLLGFAVIDTAAHAIYEAYVRSNTSYLTAIAHVGAAFTALLPALQILANLVSHRQSRRANPTAMTKWLAHPAISAMVATLLIAPLLILFSLLAHIAYSGGGAWPLGAMATGAALLFSILFSLPKAITFINRSSLNQTYAARLARAYLGASNPLRFASRTSSGRNIDEVMPDDDAESFLDYRPFAAGGPLHIIGTCVNETEDQITLREARDRQGMMMAVSPLGLSVGRHWHAEWPTPKKVNAPPAPKRRGWGWKKRPSPVEIPPRVVGHLPGTPHPLLDEKDEATRRLEVLNLRQWMSISGGAFGSGMGQKTNKTASFLFTLGNLRTGYWWDSGLSSADRGMRPQVSFLRRLLWLLPRLFLTQSQLLNEALARFPGPWAKYWYLSDGGHFENLGLYELVRRRVPYMIATDAGADPDYDFDDFANLQRKLRIDFEAEVQLFTETHWEEAVAKLVASGPGSTQDWESYFKPIRQYLAAPGPNGGTFDELTPTWDTDQATVIAPAKKSAALFRIVYRDGRRNSLLLYIKASVNGDEPADVRQYDMENQDFPHQSTADQFFDEAQWESYRCLGEHIAGKLLKTGPLPAGVAPRPWLTFLT